MGAEQAKVDKAREQIAGLHDGPLAAVASTVAPQLQSELQSIESHLEARVVQKRTLEQAQQEREAATEAEQAAKQRRLSADTAVAAAWRAAIA